MRRAGTTDRDVGVLFGSADCRVQACDGDGPQVRSWGAFGSIEILTREAYERRGAG